MNNYVELFSKARAFLASKAANRKGEFARNVRIADVVAVTSAALTGTVGIGPQATTYSGSGTYNGPLDQSGNMPASSAGLIIGTSLMLPKRWAATEEPAVEQAYQQLAQDCSQVIRVAGTDVVAAHATYGTHYASVGNTGVATGPLYGIPGASAPFAREPQPLLWVGPGDRVEQSLLVRRALGLGAVSITPELVVTLVIAELGVD